MSKPRGTHPAIAQVLGYVRVEGIAGPVPRYAEGCAVCGRKVRLMPGLGGPGVTVFHHAGGVVKGTKR